MADQFKFPIVGSRWQHISGPQYVVSGLALNTATGNVDVIYGREGHNYTRDISNFMGSTNDHKRRFTPVGEE